VRLIGRGGHVRIGLDDGTELNVRVRPDDPVEIELPDGVGTANLVEGLGAEQVAPRPRTGHRTTYVPPTKWGAGRKIIDGTVVGKL
jgi:hypothetical protein